VQSARHEQRQNVSDYSHKQTGSTGAISTIQMELTTFKTGSFKSSGRPKINKPLKSLWAGLFGWNETASGASDLKKFSRCGRFY